ncbi:MAG: peptide-N4-asparagine amidase [Thermoplasmatota archaeon]
MRLLAAVAVVLLLVLPATAQTGDGEAALLVPNQGQDLPPAGLPVATIYSHQQVLHPWGGNNIHAEVTPPDAEWDRVYVTYRSIPVEGDGDPWDRLFHVFIEGTEVLRGTTPRGDFWVTDDITEYASLMQDPFTVTSKVDVWQGTGFYVDIRFDFFDDVAPVELEHTYDSVHSAFTAAGLRGTPRTTTVDFGSAAPSGGILEFFTSGHEQAGEFWWMEFQTDFPRFDIYVDGEHAGHVIAMPYIYALLGFCCDTTTQLINQAMWTAPWAAEEASGAHLGVGEIPSYRAAIPDHILPLLTGDTEVTMVKTNHGGWWPSSVNFLLDA